MIGVPCLVCPGSSSIVFSILVVILPCLFFCLSCLVLSYVLESVHGTISIPFERCR
jgi:hypothetical protein